MCIFSISSFADKIKCDVKTTLIARHGVDLLLHVDFSDPTMPSGYKVVSILDEDDSPEELEVLDAPGIGRPVDHEDAAAQWIAHCDYGTFASSAIGDGTDDKLRLCHAAVLSVYNNGDMFVPG